MSPCRANTRSSSAATSSKRGPSARRSLAYERLSGRKVLRHVERTRAGSRSTAEPPRGARPPRTRRRRTRRCRTRPGVERQLRRPRRWRRAARGAHADQRRSWGARPAADRRCNRAEIGPRRLVTRFTESSRAAGVPHRSSPGPARSASRKDTFLDADSAASSRAARRTAARDRSPTADRTLVREPDRQLAVPATDVEQVARLADRRVDELLEERPRRCRPPRPTPSGGSKPRSAIRGSCRQLSQIARTPVLRHA